MARKTEVSMIKPVIASKTAEIGLATKIKISPREISKACRKDLSSRLADGDEVFIFAPAAGG
jgi:molybdopterin converting factor small subunit